MAAFAPMSASHVSPESSEVPCTHCGTALNDKARFCFECGVPVILEFDLPDAPASALEELPTAAFSPVSIRPIEEDPGLTPGEPVEIESLGFEVVVDEVRIDMDDMDDDDDGPVVADPNGTVIAIAPERPLPFWPAPPRGETVIAPAPTAPHASAKTG